MDFFMTKNVANVNIINLFLCKIEIKKPAARFGEVFALKCKLI